MRVPGAARPTFAVDPRLWVALAALPPTVVIAYVVANRPDLLRLAFAGAFVAAILAVAVRRPAAAVFLTLLALPFEALFRRLLIDDAGFGGNDPLILTGPLISIVLFASLFFVRRRPLVTDALSGFVLVFVGLGFLGILNPAGRGIAVEAGGLLFLTMPLLWFFLGRELGSPELVARLFRYLVGIAIVVGAYGLWQTEFGFPSWDALWWNLAQSPSYQSLTVGSSLRPFSTFSSNQEYALWLACAIAVAVASALHGRGTLILAVPVLTVALLYASVRSTLVLGVLAITMALGLRSRRLPVAAAIVVIGMGAAFGALQVYGAAATEAASGNELVARQVSGLANPLDPRQSTFLLHWDMYVGGIQTGIRTPLGYGPGSTNLAVAKLGGTANVGSTEIDVSNAFVSLGLLGGLTFIGILFLAFRDVTRRYLSGEALALPVLALLVVCLGQWLTGGLYALMPLFWFVLGWGSAPPSSEETP